MKIDVQRFTGSALTQFGRPTSHIPILPPLPQRMIHQHQRQHRLRNRRCANANTRVMASFGGNLHRITRLVDGVAFEADAGGGLDGVVRDNILPGGDTAEDAARII